MILLFYLSDSTSKVFCFPTLTDLLSTSNAIGWWYFIFMKNLVNRTEYSNSSWSKITSPGSLKLGIRFDSPVLSECYLYLSTQRSVQNFFTLTVKQLGMWEDLWQYTKAMRNTENRRRLMYYQLGKNNPKVYRIIANIKKKTLNVAFFYPNLVSASLPYTASYFVWEHIDFHWKFWSQREHPWQVVLWCQQ